VANVEHVILYTACLANLSGVTLPVQYLHANID